MLHPQFLFLFSFLLDSGKKKPSDDAFFYTAGTSCPTHLGLLFFWKKQTQFFQLLHTSHTAHACLHSSFALVCPHLKAQCPKPTHRNWGHQPHTTQPQATFALTPPATRLRRSTWGWHSTALLYSIYFPHCLCAPNCQCIQLSHFKNLSPITNMWNTKPHNLPHITNPSNTAARVVLQPPEQYPLLIPGGSDPICVSFPNNPGFTCSEMNAAFKKYSLPYPFSLRKTSPYHTIRTYRVFLKSTQAIRTPS